MATFGRTNGIQSINRLRNEMDRLFGTLLQNQPFEAPGAAFPPMNVWEDSENLYLEAELPGLKMDDLDITLNANELTITAERKPVQQENVAFHRRERGVGRFSRLVRLPSVVNSEKCEARLVNGVLTLTLPKAEEAKPRKIAIKTA